MAELNPAAPSGSGSAPAPTSAPAVPAAPAPSPAPSRPADSAPAAPRATVPPAPATPAAPASPPASPGQPADSAPAGQGAQPDPRLSAAQAWGHSLSQQLQSVLRHPEIGERARSIITGVAPAARPVAPAAPVAAQPAAPAQPAADGQPQSIATDPEIARAFQQYRDAPDDVTAYAHLVQVVEERATRAAAQQIMRDLNQRAQQNRTRVGVERAKQGVATAVNTTLKQHFPDVNLKIFWQVAAPQAQQETPPHLTDFTQRIQWQTERAVQLTREMQASFAGPVNDATAEANALRQGAAAVMPGGGPSRPARPANPAKPVVSWQDQIRGTRERAGIIG